MGELVSTPHDKVIKGVFGIQGGGRRGGPAGSPFVWNFRGRGWWGEVLVWDHEIDLHAGKQEIL